MFVRKIEEVESIPYGQGAQKRIMIGEADGAPTFVMRVFDVIPGGASSHHAHDFEHEVLVLKGAGVLKNDGPDIPFSEGSAIYVAPNETHQLVNTGRDTLRFVCSVPLRGEH
jgi:quercetin dioxygenase-like cupin family protein